MWKRIAALVAGGVIALSAWLYFRSSRPPEAQFARVRRERIESVVTTNGKVEPVEWAAARSEIEGLISQVPVSRGQNIRRGQTLAVIEARGARGDLAAAESRIAQAKAEIETLERGGRSGDVAAIDASLQSARQDRDIAARDLAALERLQSKGAATRVEVEQARDRLDRATAQIASLTTRRTALVNPGDLSAARARLIDAEAAAKLAREKIVLASVTAPIDGVIYELAVLLGAYVSPGALIANVGRVERLRAIVYVDEPDLGRIRPGLPVTITWDALPGREWKGTVDKVPVQVMPLGTRQVGEVLCLIDNPDRALLPGTNINAAIRSELVENALTIPREALRRSSQQTGVFVLDGEVVRWRPVKPGVSNVARIQILDGLREGDAVAVVADASLRDGAVVAPTFAP